MSKIEDNINKAEAIAGLAQLLVGIGTATVSRIKKLGELFTLSEAELDARLDKSNALAQSVIDKAQAEIDAAK
jgi:hypothetical protein